MSDYSGAPEGEWDEYEWERFLQKQDQRTEKYMELLEKYLDHPQRDQIIAREMGWSDVGDDHDWSDEVEALMHEGDSDDADSDERPVDSFEDHALYRAAFALTMWMDQLFDENGAL